MAFDFLNQYDKWDEVEMILHQGGISSTTETDVNKIHKYNVEFSIALFEKAIEYSIPVKYASSASVYGKIHSEYGYLKEDYQSTKLLCTIKSNCGLLGIG